VLRERVGQTLDYFAGLSSRDRAADVPTAGRPQEQGP